MKKLVWIRRISQVFFFLLFLYILWSTTYPLTGLISPEVIFKTNPLIMFVIAISERIFLSGLVLALGMIILTLILGRFFCGWVCPLGAVIDFFGLFRRKSKAVLSYATNLKIRKLKYFILGIIFAAALLGIQIAWVLDPLVLTARFVSLDLIPTVTFAVNQLFISLIQTFHLYGPVYDFYRNLKQSFLGIEVHYFSTSGIAFLSILFIGGLTFFLSRFWCRVLCPLGATYALVAKFSKMNRNVEGCNQCGACVRSCRMGAIKQGNDYSKSECILCMDCVYVCPQGGVNFGLFRKKSAAEKKLDFQNSGGVSRKEFLWLGFSSFLFLAAKNRRRFKFGQNHSKNRVPIRPPGAVAEKNFIDQCIRCGNCMKVCPTNGLQPALMESGLEGVWTPRLVPEIGYCEYNCTLCGQVCPTGAIAKLPLVKKQKTRLGTACIDRETCLVWGQDTNCLVCEEHCPIPEKAIKIIEEEVNGTVLMKPVVDQSLCIGCGICQTKCPVRPVRAIRVRSEEYS